MADISWADVVVVASELSTVAADRQTLILLFVNTHILLDSESGEKTNLGRRYFAAHMATLMETTGAGVAGAVTKEKVDDLEREYGGTSISGTDPNLDQTSYGKMFKLMARSSVARFFVV